MTINDLYQKISDFEQKLKPSTKDKLVCNEGCSRCCYTDISIFQIEADNIREWFSHLSASSKESLRQKWREAPSVMENFFNQTVPACVFLKGESCTIYDVRPLICRTQGLPLMYKMEDQSFVDICPLNEGLLTDVDKNEVLNLDLVNLILSQMEKSVSQDESRDRVTLKSLQTELCQSEP